MAEVYIKVKKDKVSDRDTRRRQRCPTHSLIKALYTFTRPHIRLPQKITGLVRRFLLTRRNMPSGKIHCCHIIISRGLRKNIPLSKMSCFVM